MPKKVLVGGVALIAFLLVAIGVVWAFGAPQPGSTVPIADQWPIDVVGRAPQEAPEQRPEKPEVANVPADAKAPAPDPGSPLAIQIPGCKCHSDDPKLVKEHEAYRMNQCAGCHAGQTPTGQ